MIQEIVDYLKGANPDFTTGFTLFCRYSRNESLMSWIGRKHDHRKLIYELGKLASLNLTANSRGSLYQAKFDRQPAVHAVTPGVMTAEPEGSIRWRTFDDRRTRRSDLPEHLQQVFDTVASDYKLRTHYHDLMKRAATNSERQQLRAHLMETDARIRTGWKQIDDYLDEQAKVPPPEKEFSESTYRSYISKALNRERNSDSQIRLVKQRVAALMAHGCQMDETTKNRLKDRGWL